VHPTTRTKEGALQKPAEAVKPFLFSKPVEDPKPQIQIILSFGYLGTSNHARKWHTRGGIGIP
jgi:hypothetical protein